MLSENEAVVRSRKELGILHSIFSGKPKDIEGTDQSRKNHYNSMFLMILSFSIRLLCKAFYNVLKGLLQIIFYFPRSRNSLGQIFPVQNPDPNTSTSTVFVSTKELQHDEKNCSIEAEKMVDVISSDSLYSSSLANTRDSDEITEKVIIAPLCVGVNVMVANSSDAKGDQLGCPVLIPVERWIKHYSSRHKILVVGDGDFSFSAALAVAFCRASNMIATSLDSKEFLEENSAKSVSSIDKLSSRGCKVMHGIDATKLTKHPVLGNMTFDCIIYNFPFADFFPDMPPEYVLRRHRRLVSRFLMNAKALLCEDGEIHVSHKTNSTHNEWGLQSIASCHGLRLVEEVAFNHKDYPGYKPNRGFGADKNFECYPSSTYKFGMKKGVLDSSASVLQEKATVVQEEKVVLVDSSGPAQSELVLLSKEDVIREVVVANPVERWIKHYSSGHKILVVGDRDFSFSAALAVAFRRASNMIATSLDSKEFLAKNYAKSVSNNDKLSSRGCKVMHGIDATKLESHEVLGSMSFDRIIYNFPSAGLFEKMPRESQLKRHRILVSRFLMNAKKLLREDGEIHVSLKTNSFHTEWQLVSIASCQGLRLVEEVAFSNKDYPGYKPKRGFGGDKSFACYPSSITYKFGLKKC